MKQKIMESREDGSGISFLIGIIFLLGGIILSLIIFSDSKRALDPEPPLPEGVPTGIPLLYDSTLTVDSDEYIVKLEENVSLWVEFNQLGSFKKLWSGSNAAFQVDLPEVKPYTATTHSETWGNVLVSQAPGNQEFDPWIQTTINFDQNYFHTWVIAHTSVSVVYPSVVGNSFTNLNIDLFREIKFYGVTDEEFELIAIHDDWQSAIESYENKDYIGGYFCSGVLFLVGGFFIYTVIKFRIEQNLKRKYSWLR